MMAADARFERRHIVSAADKIRYLAAERPSAAFSLPQQDKSVKKRAGV